MDISYWEAGNPCNCCINHPMHLPDFVCPFCSKYHVVPRVVPEECAVPVNIKLCYFCVGFIFLSSTFGDEADSRQNSL